MLEIESDQTMSTFQEPFSIIINVYQFAMGTERSILYEIGEGKQMSSRFPGKDNA